MWYEVKDQKPPQNTDILVLIESTIRIGSYSRGSGKYHPIDQWHILGTSRNQTPSHWHPLPPPPKG